MSILGCGAEIEKLKAISDEDVQAIEDVLKERMDMGITRPEAQRQAVAEAIAMVEAERGIVMDAIRAKVAEMGKKLSGGEVVAKANIDTTALQATTGTNARMIVVEKPAAQYAARTEQEEQRAETAKPITRAAAPEPEQVFKTKQAAREARKLQPMMRVVKRGNGYVLVEKTERQLAAEQRAARRLGRANTSPAGQPIAAHEFIAAEGGLRQEERAEMSIDGNPMIGNRHLFAAKGKGLTIEQATEKLVQDGYLSEGASHNDAYALIKRSLTQPQYNADGWERIAEMEAATRFDDYLAEQEDKQLDQLAPLNDGFTQGDMEQSGYEAAPDAIKAEVQALLAMAEAHGIDTESILEDASKATSNGTENDYYQAAKSAIEAAIRASEGNRSQDAGSQGEAQGTGTEEVLGERFKLDFGAGFGEVPYRASTKAKAPDGGRILSSELVVRKTNVTKRDADDYGLPRTIEAWRVSVVENANGGTYSMVEYMDKNHGRTPDGEVIGYFEELDGDRRDALDRIAPAINKMARTAWENEKESLLTSPTRDQVIAQRSVGAADTFVLGGDAEQNLTGQGDVFASEPAPEYSSNQYETDLFGNPLPTATGRAAKAKPDSTGVRGNVQPASAIQDTKAPDGSYYVNTFVGTEVERELGASVIKTAQDAAKATQYLYKSAVERLDGIITDKDGKPLAVVGGFKGAVSQTSVYPSTLLAEAVRIEGAANIWLSHNHPSGKPTLSSADRALNATLASAFSGSGIEPRGLLAIAGDQFEFIDALGRIDQGESTIPKSVVRKRVPVIERQLQPGLQDRYPISSPVAARSVAGMLYDGAKQPGIMLLDAQNKLAAWVPIPDLMRGKLRGTGGLNAIYRAVSQSNANAAVIAHGGELDAIIPMAGITISENIAAALEKIEVRPLDSINVKTGRSAAETGLGVANGPVYAQRRGQDATSYETQAVQSGIEGKSLIQAAQFVASTGSPAQREIAKRVVQKLMALQSAGVTLDLKIAHRGDMVPAGLINSRGYTETGFDDKGRDIVVWLNGADVTSKVGTDYETLLHELVHAATTGAILHGASVKNSVHAKSVADLKAVSSAIERHINNRFRQADAGSVELTEFEKDMRASANNAFRNMDEVVAWALSSSEAQQYLESIPYQGGSMWTRFVRAVREFLGLSAASDTALSEVLRVAEAIMNPQDANFHATQAFWHKRGIKMAQQQALGSKVLQNVRNERAEPFYSELSRQIEAANINAAPVIGWKAMLKGLQSKGVKADEITWSGIEEWLDLQTGKVSKADVLAYLDANGVQVQETVLGQPDDADIEALLNDEVGEGMSRDEAIEYLNNDEGATPTKYDQYQLPGGENYREVLLTLPKRVPEYEFRTIAQMQDFLQSNPRPDLDGLQELEKFKAINKERRKAGEQQKPYQSSHWSQPNVIAHIRVNDRTDADGARVLFVEELQSDWGQQGKKQGFGYKDKTPLTKAEDDELMALYELRDRRTPDQTARMNALNNRLNASQGKAGIPAAPFVDKTDKWLALALKRIIKMAVDGGYDKVAFVNGEQSADRYDLSKQIERVIWVDNSTGGIGRPDLDGEPSRGSLEAYDHNGKQVVRQSAIDPSEVENYVGKEIARRLFEAKPTASQRAGIGMRERALRGLDLKVGGEGMKTFYDSIIPNATKALLKKLGGGQMSEISINGESEYSREFPSEAEAESWAERNLGDHGYSVRGFSSARGTFAVYDEFTHKYVPASKVLQQPGFTITPAMREKASAGLPLFRRQLATFSRGAQQQANTAVQSTVDKLTADWQNKPEIVIAFDMQDEAIPENVRKEDAKQRSGGAFGNPEGFYYKGVVYLLSSQLATDADIARVLAHESLGHYGLRGLYGKALKPILQQVATMRRADVIAVARQRGLVKVDGNNRPIVDVKTATNAQVWAAMTDSHKSQSAEEVLAEMAQTTPQAGFVKRAVAAIRQWLREHGFNLKLTDNDIIVNYILPARGWVERGPGGGGPKGGISFARGAQSKNAENTRYARGWYDRFVRLLPDSYRNDPYRREPIAAEDRDVLRDAQVRIDALNKELRGPHDRKGHGPVTLDKLGNLQVDVRVSPYWDITGKIKDLADQLDLGIVVTGANRHITPKFHEAGFESEISLAAIADRLTGVREKISDEKSVYAVPAFGAILSYKPRGFPMALFSRAVANDPVNPDIRFSRAAMARDLTQKASDAVRVFTNTPGKVNWWHKTVGTQYNLAQRSPEFKRVYDAVQDFIGDVSFYATEAADLAPKILPKLDTWRDIAKSPLSADDTKAIAAPIFEGTLVWARNEAGQPVKVAQLEEEAALMSSDRKAQRLLRNYKISEGVLKMWRGLPLEQYEALIDSKYEKEMLKAGVVWLDAELRSQFSLSDAQIALYREFRAATDKSLTNLAISDMLYFGGKDVAPIKEAVLEARTVVEASEMLRDYLLSLADMDPDNAESLIATANKMIDKGDRAADLIERGYAPLSRFGTYTLDVVDAGGERVYFGLFESRFEADRMAKQMAAEYPGGRVEQGTLSEESYKLFAGVSPETVALFGDMLGLEDNGAYQDYLKLAKSTRSAMKRLIERKGIAGFSEDAGRVLAGFVYSNARQTSQNMHTGEMVQAANDIPKGMGELKDKATQLVEYIKHPVEEAQKVRGLLFAQYIGGSVASAMVNMTQPFTMTMPWLSQFGGLSKAAKQMSAAVKDATRKTTGNTALDAALKRGEEDGTVSPQEVHDLMRQAQGKGALKSGDGTKLGNATAAAQNAVSRIAFAWGKLFSTAEQFNRRVTFIAAYRTAVEQGLSNPDAFARRAIHETQGVYNKGNKPDWARGAVGSTLFTFKQYSIAYVEMLHRMATTGAPGSPERAAGRRGALYALAVLVLLSGVGGLPGADDLDDIISGLMQSLGYNFDSKAKRKAFLAEYLGDGAQQFIERGVSGIYGVPIDVSGRLGLGNLVPATGLLTKKTDHTSDVAELLGPAGDLAKRAFQAGGKLIEGDVLGTHGAVATASPKAIQNLFQAADMATTGMYRDARGKKVIETSPGDALSKALGFQPNDVKRQQDATWEVQRMVGLNRITETEIADRWAIGLFEKDADKVQAARDDLARWNADNPDSPISIKFSQILQRVRSMNQTKAERIAKSAPKELRAQVREALSQQ